MATLTQAMNAAEIQTDIKRVDTPAHADKWERSAYHYLVTFTIKGLIRENDRSMTVPYATGNGWTCYPSPAQVMRNLFEASRDVHPVYGNYRFEPWANEWGYDTDSRKIEAMFKAIQEQAYELETLLTRPVLEAWLADDELSDSEDTDPPKGRAIKRIPAKDRKF